MPFCRQSTLCLHFCISFCSLRRSIDECTVDLLFLLFLCGILLVLRGTIRGLLASCKSFPQFELLFFISSVGTLWFYCCWGGSFFRVFLDQNGLSFGHPFGYSASIHPDSQSVVDESEF